MNKYCKTCGSLKDVSEFPRKSANPDGLSNYCRTCQSATRPGAPRASKATPAATLIAAEAAVGHRTTAETDFILPTDVIGTWAAVQRIGRSGKPAPNMVFTGPSGSGKTEAARALARLAGLEVVKMDAPSVTDPEAWFGTREVVVENGAPRTEFHESAFASALQRRCVLIIDEFNRVSDAVRNILLSVLDDSREVTNPLTGQPIVRHPECYVILTGNVGLSFTGTYAVDPAFYTRALSSTFDYLDLPRETALAISRTGCSHEHAGLFARFADETRQRARSDEDFPPISTREVLAACDLVAVGLDPATAARQVVINSANGEGGAESIKARLEIIWTGLYAREGAAADPDTDEDGNP